MKDTTSLRLGRETFLSLGSKVVMAAVGFGGTVIFARLLGPSGLGVYKTAVAAAFVLTQVTAGTGTAIKKRVSEVDVEPDEYLGTGVLVNAGFTALLVVIYLLFRPVVDAFFESSAIAIAVLAVVFALGLFNVVNRMYSGLGYPAASSWIDCVRSVLTIGFQLVLVFLGYGAFGLVAGFVVGTFLSALLSALVAGVVPSTPGKRAIERVTSFARWSVSNALLNVGYGRADVLLVAALVGSSAVGFYTTAIQLTMPGAMFGGSIRDALSVKTSGRSSAGLDIREDLENSLSYAGLLSLPILFGALAIPRPIMVTIFGPEFEPAWTALVGLTLFKLLHVYRLPFEAAAEGSDNPDLIFRTNALVFVAYAPVAVLLGIEYGLLGVIAGSVFGELARLGVYQYVSHRQFGGVVLPRPILGQVVSGVVMFAVVSALVPGVVTITSWMWLAAVVFGGAATYFATLLALSGHFRHTTHSTLVDTLDLDR
jgi:O-antigen/teichoic acid export membrane protein